MKLHLLLFTGFFPFVLLAQEKKVDSTFSRWKFSIWTEFFILPGEQDYFNPTFYAEHKNLHLEGRYNYEDRNTASTWAGKIFRFGKPVEFEIVPMGGLVFGNSNGMAPGLEIGVTYKKLDFYSESEYLFDFKTQENDFFYVYSELAVKPVSTVRTGIMAQRTKLFESEKDIQRGLFAEYYIGKCRAGFFYFNPLVSGDYWILSFSVDFLIGRWRTISL